MRRAGLFVLALLAQAAAQAHDSWLSPAPGARPASAPVLALTTGNRYPVAEFNPGADSLVQARCSDGRQALPLTVRRDQPKSLELRAAGRRPVLACWLEIKAYDLDMPTDKVQLYFDEIRAPEALRERWRGLQAQGLPWRERYRKFVRIELPAAAGAAPAERAAARAPAGLPLEAVVLGDGPIAAGQQVEFQVLRDGRPLAGQPVELVSERSALGIWRQTDAQGRVAVVLPFGGEWLLRGTELLPVDEPPGHWSSRFLTLTFHAR